VELEASSHLRAASSRPRKFSALEQAAEERERESESHARAAADRSHTLQARAERCRRRSTRPGRAPGRKARRSAGRPRNPRDVVDIDEGCERGSRRPSRTLRYCRGGRTAAARDALRHLHDAGLHGGVLPTGGLQVPRPCRGDCPQSSTAGQSRYVIGSGHRPEASARCSIGFLPMYCSVVAG